MNNSVVDRIERICDESQRTPGNTAFWFTRDKISFDDVFQVSADFNKDGEYGFMVKSHAGEYWIYFCVHKWKRRFFAFSHPHVMQSRCVARFPVDINNLKENHIQEWFDFVNHRFKKKYQPNVLDRE